MSKIEPVIKSKTIGPFVDREGCEYYRLFHHWETPFVMISHLLQLALWYIGVACHNPVIDSCTPDFNCCEKIGRRCWLRIGPFMAQQLFYGVFFFLGGAVTIKLLWW